MKEELNLLGIVVESVVSLQSAEGDFPVAEQVETRRDSVECDDTLFKCTECSRLFESAELLRAHLHAHNKASVHYGTIEQLVQTCKLLRQRRVRAEPNKALKCGECSRLFRCRAGLVSHAKVHNTDSRAFDCDVCPKTFGNSSHLIRHKKIHAKKLFQCDRCRVTFTRPDSLAVHKRTHSGSRPYKCNACGKTFTLRKSLTIHERVHTGEKPHGCLVCHKKYSDPSSLRKHNKAHHRAE